LNEIALFLLDIANNSITAQATLIIIKLIIDPLKDVIRMVVSDNGCGMDEETIQAVISPFYSTRTTRKIGLGIPLIKQSCEASNGSFELQSKVNEGTTLTMEWQYSHIDTVPIGDIGATMMTLIGANSKIDYLLHYQSESNALVFDTREVKTQLGEDDLSDPEVLGYLRDYINQQIAQ